MENIIYINNKTEQHVPEGYPNTTAYYREEAVIEIIRQVVNDANHLIDISTTVHKIKLDAEKYIPHVVELLRKGGKK